MPSRRSSYLCWILLLGSFCGHALAASTAPVPKEYRLKAGFLYNFAKFVSWPTDRFSASDAPIVIGVYNVNPFGDELVRAVKGREINGHGLVFRIVHSEAEASEVHLLFIPAGEEDALAEAKARWAAVGVVTVGETEKFARLGGVITFVAEEDRLRFGINLDAAASAHVKISAQLLKLASEVHRNR